MTPDALHSTAVPLGTVAHARAGDKGNSSILMVASNDRSRFDELMTALTPAVIATHFGTTADQVTVTPAASLGACSIVIRNALEGGVTRSLRVDPHGKTLSSHLLDLMIAWPSDGESGRVNSRNAAQSRPGEHRE